MHLQRVAPAPGRQLDPAVRNRALLAAGLVLIAVLSAVVWWLIRHDPAPEPTPVGAQPPGSSSAPAGTSEEETTTSPGPTTVDAGPFTFESMTPNQATDSCENASYGKVRAWFADHPCERVVRGLYSTEAEGARALVSVVVVTMPDEGEAQQLKTMTDTSGTGNVSDLLRDGTVELPGAPEVAGGAYASNTSGNTITVVESAFYGDTKNQSLLDEITAHALQIAPQMR